MDASPVPDRLIVTYVWVRGVCGINTNTSRCMNLKFKLINLLCINHEPQTYVGIGHYWYIVQWCIFFAVTSMNHAIESGINGCKMHVSLCLRVLSAVLFQYVDSLPKLFYTFILAITIRAEIHCSAAEDPNSEIQSESIVSFSMFHWKFQLEGRMVFGYH